MSKRKFDYSSDESDICYRRKKPRPIYYTSDENTSEVEYSIETSCLSLLNLHLSTNITFQVKEWQPIQTTETEKEVIEHERGQDAELLIQNINCNDPLEIYRLFLTDSIIHRMVQQTNEYAMQSGIGKKTKNIRAAGYSLQ